ncbi:MAG: DinB family protein [Terriglobia bacterium]
MELPSYFQRLFAYDAWGNRESLASMDPAIPGIGRALKIFTHIVGAERVWLARLRQQDTSLTSPWPELSADECRAAVDDLAQQWKEFLGGITPERLDAAVVYRNTKGAEFQTPLVDLLQHLVTHSAYHRGQIAALVRLGGGKPAATDYVVYTRRFRDG